MATTSELRHPIARWISAFGVLVLSFGPPVTLAQHAYVNWESAQVHPLDLTPDRLRLLALNTADNRLEVFDVSGESPVQLGAIPVGLDPVSVRARTNDEAWVANHVSDSISIIDLPTMRVRWTIACGDEPTDVVFAGFPERAFVCLSQLNQIKVYDPADLAAPPLSIAIEGEDPRALAADGSRVFAAIFESGTHTTILSEFEVSNPAGPYAGQNPPPNAGVAFNPPIGTSLPAPPAVGLIVRKDIGGAWRDDNGTDWSAFVTWDLHDHDVAIIDAASLSVSYARGLMNHNTSLVPGPGGRVLVVGTEAMNEVRFEPNLRGKFVKARLADFDPGNPAAASIHDLNPHLTYATSSVPPAAREEAVGEPRGIVWESSGGRGFVSGMGSNNVIAIDISANRLGRVDVGQGPTGLALNESQNRLYVLNKFDASISTIDTATLVEQSRIAMHDPTPAAIRVGRPHLYDTHKSSGLGQVSCASCHPEGGMDGLAWDLGNPAGQLKMLNQTCSSFPITSPCGDWHPMKGPMVTQLLAGLQNSAPLHWRGDRANLAEFNRTFVELLGADSQITPAEMTEFSNFIATIRFPPNPNRNFDGSLKTALPNGGNPVSGLSLMNRCSTCHFPGQGFNQLIMPKPFRGDSQSFNTSTLRLVHEKVGLDKTRTDNSRGFGFLHDGHTDTLFSLLSHPVFAPGGVSATFVAGAAGDQQRRDVEAFMLSEAPTQGSTHACIGVQATLVSLVGAEPAQVALLDAMTALVDSFTFPIMAVVVKGKVNGEPRGWYYLGAGVFQADRPGETISTAALRSLATPGGELTFTMVPDESRVRIGVDRDADGHFDRYEIDNCSDPANALSVPIQRGDVDANGLINEADVTPFVTVLLDPGTVLYNPLRADLTCNSTADSQDVQPFLDRIMEP